MPDSRFLPPSLLPPPRQLEAVPFSLEHPTQYFLESRKVRGGLAEVSVKEKEGVEEGVGEGVEEGVGEGSCSAAEFADLSAADFDAMMDMS